MKREVQTYLVCPARPRTKAQVFGSKLFKFLQHGNTGWSESQKETCIAKKTCLSRVRTHPGAAFGHFRQRCGRVRRDRGFSFLFWGKIFLLQNGAETLHSSPSQRRVPMNFNPVTTWTPQTPWKGPQVVASPQLCLTRQQEDNFPRERERSPRPY